MTDEKTEDQPMPELNIRIDGRDDGTIHIDFGQPISNLVLNMEGAAGMAGTLSMVLAKMLTPASQIIQTPQKSIVTPP